MGLITQLHTGAKSGILVCDDKEDREIDAPQAGPRLRQPQKEACLSGAGRAEAVSPPSRSRGGSCKVGSASLYPRG